MKIYGSQAAHNLEIGSEFGFQVYELEKECQTPLVLIDKFVQIANNSLGKVDF